MASKPSQVQSAQPVKKDPVVEPQPGPPHSVSSEPPQSMKTEPLSSVKTEKVKAERNEQDCSKPAKRIKAEPHECPTSTGQWLIDVLYLDVN